MRKWFAGLIVACLSGAPLGAQGRPGSGPAAGRIAPGQIPRMPDGKPDFSGVWDRPFVADMSKNGKDQQGEPNLPFTDWAKQHLVEEFDYSAHCLPLGYTRGINSPMPVEFVQRPGRLVILYEMNHTFHVIFTDGRGHPKDLEPTWWGDSIGKWDGDTLVIDTVGLNDTTRIDTAGHPHTPALRVTERFQLTDADHISYEVTITDPGAYTRPWSNKRTFTRRPD
ncbi:MAG TPA: hypothetical protein VJ732_18115, partial [Bryobacteraceae bacterium]|nr:hypothetical protein [Bryobacteraceae bacterium]